jgi:putative ABC transport system permease protein
VIPLRLRSIFRRSRVEDELAEEMRFHLEQSIEHEIAAGKKPEEARYATLLAMDGIDQRKEECRDMRHLNPMDNLFRDVRHGARTLARNPGFTFAALLALGLGIGANTAVFSVVNGVLLRPLSYADPDRLVMVFQQRALQGRNLDRSFASVADFLDWKSQAHSFQTLDAVLLFNGRFTLAGDGDAEQVVGSSVTSTFFETLGVRPLLGRTFRPGEDQPGLPQRAVISEHLWHRRYASSPGILGKQVQLNGRPCTIVGVMPSTFEFLQPDADVWSILTLNPPTRRPPFSLFGIGRLKPGVTMGQAGTEMEMVARDVERAHPNDYNHLSFPVVPLREVIVRDARPLLWVLSGAVLLVLLIAVSNVANLLLARATARQREVAIRLSIGAGKGRLVRQFMTESLMLSLAGGGVGILLAFAGVSALRALGPRDWPRLSEIGIDINVLAFTLLVSLVSAVFFGFVPALAAANTSVAQSLKEGGRGGESRRLGRARGALVIAQVMFSVLLLIGAGLLIRSFNLLGQVHAGFQAPPERILTMIVAPSGPRYQDRRALAAYWEQLLDHVRAVPGVESASLSITIPPNRVALSDGYEIEGRPWPPGSGQPVVPVPIVSRDYFRTLGIPLLDGRWFDQSDTADSHVTVITEAMARRHFSGENPIGHRLRETMGSSAGPYMEIIGVAGDVKYQGLGHENEPIYYQLSEGSPFPRSWLLVRTRSDAELMVSAIRDAIRHLDPGVPVDRISTMAQALSDSVALPRFRSLLMTVFAMAALLLAAIGIYGVLAYSVAQRAQEIGVRMALGATVHDVLKLVIGQGSRLAAVGIALGLTGALGLTRVLKQMLFGVTASDTVTLVSAALILGGVAVAASLIPALRAARIAPSATLREE